MIRKNLRPSQQYISENYLNCDDAQHAKKKKLHLNKKKLASQVCVFVASALLLSLVLFFALTDRHQDSRHPYPSKIAMDVVEVEAERKRSRKAEMASNEIHARLHRYTKKDVGLVGPHEPLLTFLVSSMLIEDSMFSELLSPKGGILDCGAQNGEQGAHYAVSSPRRQVISMDPSPKLVQQMKDTYGSLENFEIRQGGLGREIGTMKPRDDSFGMDMNTEFPVYTIDSMYFDKNKALAFAHLDLEGAEYDALQGGLKTIQANKPVFTVELRVHETKKTKQLLDLIDSLGYDTYVIDEPCGLPHIDLRNILCIPRCKSIAFGKSNGFGMLLMMEALVRVTSSDIAQFILPCCALGGECCPGDDINGKNCCREKVVIDWFEKNKGLGHEKPPIMLGFRKARQEFLKKQWRLRQRQFHAR